MNEVYNFRKFLEENLSNLKEVKPLYFTNFNKLKLLKRGKVRDIYEIGDYLLIVSTDRISAFDVILPTPIPLKGMILNMMSYFWFDKFKDLVENHVVSVNPEDYPEECREYLNLLRYRSMLVRKMNVYKIECIVRGYLAGSGYEEYIKNNSICGIKLPEGLKMSSKLPEPIFTPSTKSDVGHDINISIDQAREIVGDMIQEIRHKSIEIFKIASENLESKGILLCDTKFEFGFDKKSKLVLIDEVLTPDSSRFWLKETYREGVPQESHDKQFVRDYLKTLVWDKSYPGPDLPENIVFETAKRYISIFLKITN
ncbi:MAG: phosphoribosylaminoimidazolesuccinocarboxamide synthase [Spirochaetia bacterium]|nr:phosphoribosylaminoimidazolesuccinocarboxamide synthase [Spirochaetota bacterium]MCX8096425.1 phosphoribosylaminoimidazolesuccinocarboxamide synthase [Spirochaetota bacterium]MDW8112771.1 phosphoribosylaminoimidazolesuccinocarboxamide synthase [Spirochaetia bacterium]